MSERSLIRKFRAAAPSHPWLRVGPGQDCAALRWDSKSEVVFKIDQVQEGTHFVLNGREAARPYEVGWKAMAKTCSDMAAAGAWPVGAMVAVNLRKGMKPALAMELYRGISACCRKYKFALAGGDLSTSRNGLSVVVSMVGECPRGKMWTRSGAKVGDYLVVSGPLGASRASRKHLTFQPRLELAKRLRKMFGDGVHACIDITDGLSRDLRHLCDESHVGAVLAESFIPYTPAAIRLEKKTGRSRFAQALSDGEDFELLLALSPAAYTKLEKHSWELKTRFIGRIQQKAKGLQVLRADMKTVERLPDIGYEHTV